jgi:hypothetical protein
MLETSYQLTQQTLLYGRMMQNHVLPKVNNHYPTDG